MGMNIRNIVFANYISIAFQLPTAPDGFREIPEFRFIFHPIAARCRNRAGAIPKK
jgi:hypothetical protein